MLLRTCTAVGAGPAREAQARETEAAGDQAPAEGERNPRGRGQENCHETGTGEPGEWFTQSIHVFDASKETVTAAGTHFARSELLHANGPMQEKS